MRNRKPRSFKATMARAIAIPVVCAGLFGGSFAVAQHFAPGSLIDGVNPSSGLTVTPNEHMMNLAETNGCWINPEDRPENVIPGHALITFENREWAKIRPADEGFAIWLDGKPGTLHAFCP